MNDHDEIAALIETGRRVLSAAAKIQDVTGLADDFPAEERRQLADTLASEYHTWYARVQALLPESDAKEIRKLYEGGFFTSGIKGFFSDPLKVNPLRSEQTAPLIPFWLHEYSSALKGPMLHQLSILERRLHQRPAVIRVADTDIRLPRTLKGHQGAIETFLGKNPYEKNVFLMMKYRDSNRHIGDIIRAAVSNAGLKMWLASDVRITDELGTNVLACLLSCKYGVALFDEPEDHQNINPNVSYELGMMHLLDRDCLILKSKNVNIQSDILAKLYIQYDPTKPGELISMTRDWLVGVGAATTS